MESRVLTVAIIFTQIVLHECRVPDRTPAPPPTPAPPTPPPPTPYTHPPIIKTKLGVVQEATDRKCPGKCLCQDKFGIFKAGSKYCCDCDSGKVSWNANKGCFPSSATVKVENGKSVEMSQLQIGDKVEAVLTNGQIVYSDIRTFLHHEIDIVGIYRSITTSSNKTISLTGKHLIYSKKPGNEKFTPIYAKDVYVGDEVLVQEANGMIPTKVIDVTSSTMQGAYIPVTMEGNIIVDGVLASCYGITDHNLAHILLSPLRFIPGIIESIYGQEDGAQNYMNICRLVGSLVTPDYTWYDGINN